MLGYLGYINISDGQHSVKINGASEITIRHSNGRATKVLTGDFETGRESQRNKNHHTGDFLLGYETKQGNKLVERLRYGKEYRDNEVVIPFAPKTWQGVHGTIRRKCGLFKDQGYCLTQVIRGKFIRQAFYWRSGAKAYEWRRGDSEIKAKYANGKPAVEVKNIKPDYKEYYFRDLLNTGKPVLSDFEKFGEDFSFIVYDKKGKVKDQGAFKHRQKTGVWIANYKEQAFYNGLMIDKAFLTLKPEQIPASRILKEKNAQVRSLLISKIGLERAVKELNGKVIHQDGANRLIELPVKCDDGNGNENGSGVRVLQVKCPSTQNDYFLGVPDFVWDHGNKTKLDTCEKARAWGFQKDDGEEIKWLKES